MKTNLDGIFKVDKKLEQDGVDFAIDDKISFRVRRFTNTNPQAKKVMANYYAPYARQVEMGTLDPNVANDILMKVFVDLCLVSWQGVEIDGKEVEYSKETALSLFKELPELFEKLWKYCNEFSNYRVDLGNS